MHTIVVHNNLNLRNTYTLTNIIKIIGESLQSICHSEKCNYSTNVWLRFHSEYFEYNISK